MIPINSIRKKKSIIPPCDVNGMSYEYIQNQIQHINSVVMIENFFLRCLNFELFEVAESCQRLTPLDAETLMSEFPCFPYLKIFTAIWDIAQKNCFLIHNIGFEDKSDSAKNSYQCLHRVLRRGRHLPRFSEFLNIIYDPAQRNGFNYPFLISYAESDAVNNIFHDSTLW